MFESLCRINPDIPEQTVRTVVDELCHTPVSEDLMLTNYQNYQEIRNGITVEYNKDGKKTSNILRLLSYNNSLSIIHLRLLLKCRFREKPIGADRI